MGRERTSNRGEALVGIVPKKRDLAILHERGWYRIPVANPPSRWPPRWFAPYESQGSGAARGVVQYLAEVRRIEIASREELFPGEPPGARAGKRYHQLLLGPLVPLARPIYASRLRRVSFIPTTVRKLNSADSLNDLFDDSPLEDDMWAALKRNAIPAERQWSERIAASRMRFLDFAIFCRNGHIAVETDGDRWHLGPENVTRDNQRDNELVSRGWSIHRFGTDQIRNRLAECIETIATTISYFKGVDEGLVPAKFVRTPSGLVRQLSMLEEPEPYDASADFDELD